MVQELYYKEKGNEFETRISKWIVSIHLFLPATLLLCYTQPLTKIRAETEKKTVYGNSSAVNAWNWSYRHLWADFPEDIGLSISQHLYVSATCYGDGLISRTQSILAVHILQYCILFRASLLFLLTKGYLIQQEFPCQTRPWTEGLCLEVMVCWQCVACCGVAGRMPSGKEGGTVCAEDKFREEDPRKYSLCSSRQRREPLR
jgi:hypothetical protein